MLTSTLTRAQSGARQRNRRDRCAASAFAFVLVCAACGGSGPATPASLGESVAMGPFTVTVSGAETTALAGGSSGSDEGVGLALFVGLSIAEPGPELTAEIEKLKEEEQSVAQAISNGRFTRRNFDDSELTARLADLLEEREQIEEEAYRRGPRNRFLRRGIRVRDAGGEEVGPGGYVTEETYDNQMRSGGSAERPFEMLAASRENAGYAEGASDQGWVLLFRLPPAARDVKAVLQNPDPREGQPRSVAVPLGKP